MNKIWVFIFLIVVFLELKFLGVFLIYNVYIRLKKFFFLRGYNDVVVFGEG